MTTAEQKGFTPDLTAAPQQPGVYLMKDASGKVIYVGKAKSLKKRLVSYWRAGAEQPVKTQRLVAAARDLEWIVTGTEKEALILEAVLIKRHRPRYNIILRDDKSLPYLRISVREDFPRLTVVRRPQVRDGALYFGPFAAAGAMRETFRLLQRAFPLRRCGEADFKRQRPCFHAQTGRCVAPCDGGRISREEYRRLVDEVVMFLRGKTKDVVDTLQERMERAAEAEEFELAAVLRDRIRAVRETVERQAVVSAAEDEADVIGLVLGEGLAELSVLFVRGGSLIGSRGFGFRRDADGAEIIAAFIAQYYPKEHLIPPEILVPLDLPEVFLLEEALSEAAGRKVSIHQPLRGAKRRLLEMAAANAESGLKLRLNRGEAAAQVERILAERLSLAVSPRRIECVDISNFQGEHAVGAIVAFQEGSPDKSGYRRYRVRLGGGPDDYAMMREVLFRRFSRPENGLPDLLLLDGGKGQLNVALEVLREMDPAPSLEVAAIAKERAAPKNTPGGVEKEGLIDRVFRPGRRNPVALVGPPLLYLARIRDEAHRFAVGYYRKVHRKGLRSALDDVPGVGPVWRGRLLKEFGSLARLKEASAEEMASRVPGLGEKRARNLQQSLLRADLSGGGASDGSME
ncbi:MAG: excinuclease ABC subunit UvrC [Pseudomonadota bacterium]